MGTKTQRNDQYPDPAQCDIGRICGSKFNTFGPATIRLDEPGRFFERDARRAMTKRFCTDDDAERWDGMD